jgi:hypothetical protein
MKIPGALPILLVLVAGLGGLGCTDISTPSRSDVYEWRRIVPTGPLTADTLSFHWPRSRLPVRIWTQNTLDLPAHVDAGVSQWKRAFLYREFDAVSVADSNAADVVVTTGSAVSANAVRLHAGLAPECEGATEFELAEGSSQLVLPIRVFVNPRFDPASPGVAECLALTTTHELGHALGILAHSPDPTDIMFTDPLVSTLSARDRATVERAYHVESNVTVGER